MYTLSDHMTYHKDHNLPINAILIHPYLLNDKIQDFIRSRNTDIEFNDYLYIKSSLSNQYFFVYVPQDDGSIDRVDIDRTYSL